MGRVGLQPATNTVKAPIDFTFFVARRLNAEIDAYRGHDFVIGHRPKDFTVAATATREIHPKYRYRQFRVGKHINRVYRFEQ